MEKINAYACKVAKGALEPFSYELPALAPYEMVIEVECTGVCHSDISLIDNDWGITAYPLVPGHEIVGKVVQIGESVDPKFLHQRVGVGWQKGACLTCDLCRGGHSNICPEKRTTCIKSYGGFAEKVLADSRFSYFIPDGLASELAAPLLCAGATVYSPLVHSNLKKGSRVAILGVGGLGHLALQFAKALGYHVTAISNSADKEKEALSFGADAFLITSQLKNKERSFDFILSTYRLGNNTDQMLSLLAPLSTLCLVTREDLHFSSSALINFERTIKGTSIADPSTMREMLTFAAKHKIAPKIEVLPFSKINEAVNRVREGKARYRIVLKGQPRYTS